MKTLAEQIKALENERAAKAARMTEVMTKSIEEGRSSETAEGEEFDDLELDTKQIDEDLVRLRKLEAMSMQSAKPVDDGRANTEKTFSRAPAIITQKHDKDEDFEGQNYTRLVIAKTLGFIEQKNPIAIANERWGKSNPHLVDVIKADVAGHGSGSGEAGAELISLDSWMGDFQEFLYSKTVYNQLNLRQVPANVTIKGQDGGAIGYWVGESKGIPVSATDYNDVLLKPLKVAALAVISKELMRDSSPSAEMLIRDSLIQAGSQRIDGTFASAAAGVAGVSPAGIFNGIAGIASAGNDGGSVLQDIKAMLGAFIAAKNTGGLVHLMNPSLASSLSLLRNALDQREFPTITEDGGTLEGRSVVTGDNIAAGTFATIKPSDIYRIGSGSIETSVSDQATIEMSDDPTGATDTPVAPTGKQVSMFQTESVAIKVVESINFAKRRASAVSWINDADYGAPVT